ncbi:IS66 family transposase [Thorsellia anophelis]|uniref:IS66 family transposase n=1 Tax=Thorsellia anophelis TaxID=336804 RepID=UPI000B8198C5
MNQWEYLTAYTQNGDWPIDNNPVEREIRPMAVGGYNWMFSDTPKGADTSALILV